MLLKIKNKVILAVKTLLNQAKTKGAIPRHIEVNEKEAIALLKELFELRSENKTKDISLFKIYTGGEVIRKNPIQWIPTSEEETLKNWKTGEYEITYDDIPIKIKDETDVPPKPIPPEGQVVKEGQIND